ncbi:ribonucleoside-diphosphate reductase subunit alpha [Dubosiella newyorkensis]|uniref:ribonucleoside-diphosphate reductase subunit alpha n=2 Tax=Dubosiella newyorkensis TaxID=1862672 RepID=UPI00235631CA|nr:ribonucleoside-diphosphate reductase subunit alpha [Dubosiella newyorkensis]MCI9041731.1 ribonucleoside-diphosphate reductase subunit alpha [Dubosiella newyorkensis]
MQIEKRDHQLQTFDGHKIKNAILKAFQSVGSTISQTHLDQIVETIETEIKNAPTICTVEQIQDLVEEELMRFHCFKEAKSYILYRDKRSQKRAILEKFKERIDDPEIVALIKRTQNEFENASFLDLFHKFQTYDHPNLTSIEALDILMRCCVELISIESPDWEMIAARFLMCKLHRLTHHYWSQKNARTFYEKIKIMEQEGYYGSYILEAYTQEEIDELERALKPDHDLLFTYSGLDLLAKRYLLTSHDHQLMELPQEMFMGIAMHLAIPEGERKVEWAKKIYTVLSTLKATMATPTMANARKPFHQMSSCFIDTVSDSLDGIYKSLDNFAKVSKFGGGMGMYFGKVRASGSTIRGFEGAAGGVIRWIKLVNDTAIAVDQLGVRSGAVAVYLDAWHKDLPEFLALRTNNGDDRQKAHDVFPGICYPNLFWKMAEESLDQMWYLMDPHEIHEVKGYHLEDCFGPLWEERYWDCVADSRIDKRPILLKDLIRLIIKSAVETGTPFTFNRDIVNEANPNSHKGMIYCSNLCTEIAQNMSPLYHIEQEIKDEQGQSIVVDTYLPGDFVVCNLASLSLGHIDVNDDQELEDVISTIIRALDNVIELNYAPIPFAKITNANYRSIGLGTSGYHHMLVNNKIRFESQEHLDFVDKLYEKINYYTIKASHQLAKEKGAYPNFHGSEWESGAYFRKRHYEGEAWEKLQEEVQREGLRNAYLLAIAPTSSTSILAGTTAAIDPIMNKFFLEEKKGSMIARIAPNLNPETFWFYKQAHHIDQSWLIRAAGVRQRHIDQSQSVNLYITNEYTLRQVLNLFIEAYRENVKTLYYVRSKSLEVEECESCSA